MWKENVFINLYLTVLELRLFFCVERNSTLSAMNFNRAYDLGNRCLNVDQNAYFCLKLDTSTPISSSFTGKIKTISFYIFSKKLNKWYFIIKGDYRWCTNFYKIVYGVKEIWGKIFFLYQGDSISTLGHLVNEKKK